MLNSYNPVVAYTAVYSWTYRNVGLTSLLGLS